MRGRSLSFFPFQLDIAFKLLLISTFLQFLSLCKIYHNTRFIKKLLFQFAWFMSKFVLKNIVLTWVTLGENSKFDTLHSFWTHYGKIHILLNVYILLYTYMLLYNVKLPFSQIAPSKSVSSLDIFLQHQR